MPDGAARPAGVLAFAVVSQADQHGCRSGFSSVEKRECAHGLRLPDGPLRRRAAIDRGAFYALAGAFEGDHVGVLDVVDPLEGDGGLAEDFAAKGERRVGGRDDRGFLVSDDDEMEERVGEPQQCLCALPED